MLHIGLALSPTWLRGRSWRAADSRVEELFDLAPYAELAAAAERAHLDFVFLPDAGHLDPAGLDTAPGFSTLDSFALSCALAASTTRIGVVPTVQTLFAEPYPAARQLMSLHRISDGRAGWNAVTALGGLDNHAAEDLPSEQRYARAAEFIEVVRRLWDSYPASALLLDREGGRFADAARVSPIDHDGRWFRVRGPLATAADPAGHPPLFQAGGSPAGIAFAGAHADAVFGLAGAREDAERQREALRAAAVEAGRPEDAVRFLPGLVLTLAGTREKAERIAEQQRTGAGPSHWAVTGTPADAVDRIVERADVIDGFIALPGGSRRSIALFLEEVVPALAERGLFRGGYTGATLREHLGC